MGDTDLAAAVAALEARLRAVEDQLAITRLVVSYGPAVDSGSAEDVVADFGLVDLIPRVRSPLLVFGAGRDMVVPPEESIALVSAAGDLATLVWYPDGGHGLYSELGDWIGLTGDWVNSLVGREDVSEELGEPEA